MLTEITIKNLGKTEQRAKEILEHVEAIKRLQKDSMLNAIDISVSIDLGENNAANPIQALTEQIATPRAQSEDNPPLTLEELRGMDDGEPVWCESVHRPGGEGWYLVCPSAMQPYEFIAVGRERSIPIAGIESEYWLAYRRKPEGGGRNGL